MNAIRRKIFLVAVIIPIFFLEGCVPVPFLKHNFRKMFSSYLSKIDDNPIIIIPGVIGSRLINSKTGKVVWGSLRAQQMFSKSSSGAIALPIDELPLEKNKDDIISGGIIDKYEFPVKIVEFTVYRELIQMFEEVGYKLGDIRNPEPGDNLYIFDYDWRRDNVETAKILAERIEHIKTATNRPSLKFNLVCHSMGGLIGEYYLRYGGEDVLGQYPNFKVTNEGGRNIKKLILIGVPNLGAMSVFQYLHTGLDLKILEYPPSVIFTMPSIYQLLPARNISSFVDNDGNDMNVDLYDIEDWKKFGWSMYSDNMIAAVKTEYKKKFKNGWEQKFKEFEVKRDRFIEAALKRADLFRESLNFKPIESAPCEVVLFGGDMVWTLNKAVLIKDVKNNKWRVSFWESHLREKILIPGDNIVTKESLLGVPLAGTTRSSWVRSPLDISFVLFVARRHEEIHKDQAFQDNLLNVLLADWRDLGNTSMMKEIFLDSADGVKIAINYYDSTNPKNVIIICHGSFMCKDAKPFLELSKDLHEYFDVITMDFRGHGRSTGSFTFTAKEPDDLRAVVNFAKRIYPRIGILGFSTGAASAIIDTAKNKDIQSLIAVSAPADVNKIENRFLRKEALIPAIEKFEFGKSPNIILGNMFSKKIKPIDVIGDISPIPVLFISGSKDPIIYPKHTLELYEKAGMPKNIENFEDGFHAEELYLKSRNRFVKICKEWFENTLH